MKALKIGVGIFLAFILVGGCVATCSRPAYVGGGYGGSGGYAYGPVYSDGGSHFLTNMLGSGVGSYIGNKWANRGNTGIAGSNVPSSAPAVATPATTPPKSGFTRPNLTPTPKPSYRAPSSRTTSRFGGGRRR